MAQLKPTHKYLLGFFALILVFIAYSNFFHNPFEYDDEHTIVNNLAIRNFHNIPSFFKDASTTSTTPANQAYRPGLTLLNTIDYSLGNTEKPNPFIFHTSIFISFILLGICIFLLGFHLFKLAFDKNQSFILALILATFFCIHTANSQTLNYIIARSDSFSTLMVVLALLIYIYLPKTRNFYLYMLPVIVGFFVKEPAIMFVPILMTYKFLFENSSPGLSKKNQNDWTKKSILVLKQSIIPIGIALSLFIFSRAMTPVGWTSGNSDSISYAMTQPFVIIHYFNSYFLPLNLSIDKDWDLVKSIADDRFIVGIIFIFLLFWAIIRLSKTHPIISFGLAWFILALLPTSSIFPFAEILNDHRPFFPYIGLSILVIYSIALIYNKYKSNFIIKYGIISFTILAFILHILGTRQQNQIWSSTESVWREATIKAPNSGRAWMIYGNQLLEKSMFKDAEICYQKAIALTPAYSYLYINLGALKESSQDFINAEINFRKGIELDPTNPDAFLRFGKFLLNRNRILEAQENFRKGLQLSPNHSDLLRAIKEAEALSKNPLNPQEEKINMTLAKLASEPTPENYLELSLLYYNAGQFENCIKASENAIQLKGDYALAYNNICTAYNQLKNWDKAIEAGEKGLKLDPNNELIKGNLQVAYNNKGK